MINVKIIILLSLAAYVAYGGHDDRTLDGKPVGNLDDGNNRCGKPSGQQNDNSLIRNKGDDQVEAEEEDDDDDDDEEEEDDDEVEEDDDEEEDGDDEVEEDSCNRRHQFDNHDTIGEINEEVKGKKLTFRGHTLLIDGKEVPGVDATERPLLIEWGNGVLKIKGEINTEFGKIEGTGFWRG